MRVAAFRDEKRAEYKREHPGCKSRDAHEWAWSEAIRCWPPGATEPVTDKTISVPEGQNVTPTPPKQDADSRAAGVAGLGQIPATWPPLPANASLAVEVGWVQSNRLSVVEELPSGSTRVHLDRAHEPAPSRAALGWLETSIRSYAKFVEVAAKSLAVAQDDQDQVRRERMKIEDIRRLLAEMHKD